MKKRNLFLVAGLVVALSQLSFARMTTTDYVNGIKEKDFGPAVKKEISEEMGKNFKEFKKEIKKVASVVDGDVQSAIGNLKLSKFEYLKTQYGEVVKIDEFKTKENREALKKFNKAWKDFSEELNNVKEDENNKKNLAAVKDAFKDVNNNVKVLNMQDNLQKLADNRAKVMADKVNPDGIIDSFVRVTEKIEKELEAMNKEFKEKADGAKITKDKDKDIKALAAKIKNQEKEVEKLEDALVKAGKDETKKKNAEKSLADGKMKLANLNVAKELIGKIYETKEEKLKLDTEKEYFIGVAKSYTPDGATEVRILENRLDINENAKNIATNKADIAVNKARINKLETRVDSLEKKVKNGISQVAAMTAVDFQDLNVGEIGIGAAVGTHDSTQSVAVGVGFAATENFKLNAKLAATPGKGGSCTASVGAVYKFRVK